MSTPIKLSITIEEQIQILKDRGMIIESDAMAHICLSNAHYYRLSAYWHPFENRYPRKYGEPYAFKEGTNIKFPMNLYLVDTMLKSILYKYTLAIEMHLKTRISNIASIEYKDNPFWYTDPSVFNKGTIGSQIYKEGLNILNHIPEIIQSNKYHKLTYAPAWQAIEYMSFGTVIFIYKSLSNSILQCHISKQFNIPKVSDFVEYMDALRVLRNAIAHGRPLYNMTLPLPVCSGPAKIGKNFNYRLAGIYIILKYVMSQLSTDAAKSLTNETTNVLSNIKYQEVKDVFVNNSGLYKEIL